MLCKNPYTTGNGEAYGCGQCLPCRINRRRLWVHRIMLEEKLYEKNSFVTLTYDDKSLPVQRNGKATLDKRHLQLFIKKLRKGIEPERLRYFGVGEYGDQSWRPHYHVVLFNFPSCETGGRTRQKRHYNERSCCHYCDMVKRAWDRGNIELGPLDAGGAEYVAGYTVKKLTHAFDPRLAGRYPEFARMSNRPGLGAGAIPRIAEVIRTYYIPDENRADVPSALRHGGKMRPLGRYLQGKLRTELGFSSDKAPDIARQQQAQEMRPLREAARASSDAPSLKQQLEARDKGKIATYEARAKIFKQRRPL